MRRKRRNGKKRRMNVTFEKQETAAGIDAQIAETAKAFILARREGMNARRERNETIAKLRGDGDGTFRHGRHTFCEWANAETPPCYMDKKDQPTSDWCDTCEAQEPFYQRMITAGKQRGVLLRKLERLVNKRGKA